MRIILRNLVVVLLLISATGSTFATTYPTIKHLENKTLIVNLNDWTKSDLTVSIQDEFGSLIYSDNVKSGEFTGKKYNLKYFTAGNYELIIESSTKKAIHQIIVLQDGLTIALDSEIIFQPTFKANDNFVEFNQLALGRDITITISDLNGEFFSKKYKNEASINTRFDITALPKGQYTAIVKGENQYDLFSFSK